MKNKFWEFKNADDKTGELMLYGEISNTSWWGDEVTPKQFKKDLDELGEIDTLNVYINSNGGDIFAGQAIYSMLKRHSATTNVYIDGLAASIASVVAMAGDKIIMPKGSMIMVHNGMAVLIGYFNAVKMRRIADDVEKITNSVVVPAYDRSGQTEDKIKELLDAETWLSAEDAVELGFADEIEEGKNMAASISGDKLMINGLDVDLGQFKNVPKSFLSLVKNTTKPEAEEQEDDEPDTAAKNDEAEKLKAEIELLNVI